MKIVAVLVILLVVVGAGAAVYFFFPSPFKQQQTKPTDIKTFEDCEAAGFLVVETQPRECYTKSDQVFVEVWNGKLLQKTIVVVAPTPHQIVESPFKIEGKAVGGWFFNSKLNARLEDDNGTVITTKEIKSLEVTKTNSMVPFVAAITFKNDQVTTNSGKLIIEKTNTTYKGQGTPLVIPVRFK
jgi:hypothetical protein